MVDASPYACHARLLLILAREVSKDLYMLRVLLYRIASRSHQLEPLWAEYGSGIGDLGIDRAWGASFGSDRTRGLARLPV